MARSFDSTTLSLLASGALEERELVAVYLDEGNFGFWNDIYDATFSEFPGVTFTGSSGVISITNMTQTVQGTVQSITAVLSGLDTTALASVGAYNLHAGTITVAKVLINPATKAIVNMVTIFDGFIDKETFTDTGNERTLAVECYSRSKEFDRSSNRVRSNADQKRRDATDDFYKYTDRQGQKIPWGQRAVSAK